MLACLKRKIYQSWERKEQLHLTLITLLITSPWFIFSKKMSPLLFKLLSKCYGQKNVSKLCYYFLYLTPSVNNRFYVILLKQIHMFVVSVKYFKIREENCPQEKQQQHRHVLQNMLFSSELFYLIFEKVLSLSPPVKGIVGKTFSECF